MKWACMNVLLTLQTSPVVMRKNVRSPVPVLDLVSKFNHPTSQETVSMNPAHNSNPVTTSTHMAKIAEKLMQNQNSKSYRYGRSYRVM